MLAQRVPGHTATGRPSPAGARFRLAARLGGTGTSSARLRVVFRSARGAVLGSAALGGRGGGGRPDMAQAGGPEGANANQALAAVEAGIRAKAQE